MNMIALTLQCAVCKFLRCRGLSHPIINSSIKAHNSKIEIVVLNVQDVIHIKNSSFKKAQLHDTNEPIRTAILGPSAITIKSPRFEETVRPLSRHLLRSHNIVTDTLFVLHSGRYSRSMNYQKRNKMKFTSYSSTYSDTRLPRFIKL